MANSSNNNKEGVARNATDRDEKRGGFLKRRTASTSASPTLSIAQCLLARVDNNAMNLPIKLSSEKTEGNRNCQRRIFGQIGRAHV